MVGEVDAAESDVATRVLQLSDIVTSLKFGPVDQAVEREAGIEVMAQELSKEIERKMFKEISVGLDERGEAGARRGRPRNWSDREI